MSCYIILGSRASLGPPQDSAGAVDLMCVLVGNFRLTAFISCLVDADADGPIESRFVSLRCSGRGDSTLLFPDVPADACRLIPGSSWTGPRDAVEFSSVQLREPGARRPIGMLMDV